MNKSSFDLYRDIAERTQGDIYIGVVGPVRTGKSTLIKRMMDVMVLPRMENEHDRQRAVDELPQSGAGKTIMTTQPKFVPNEAVAITLGEGTGLKIRMVDCVGYMIPGAMGHMEGDVARMVTTPWFDRDVSFEEAAETGTRKVIEDHSTIGLLVTTDGSITDIPRGNYISAEERVVKELKALGKPFAIVLNSRDPEREEAQILKAALSEKYNVPVFALNVTRMDEEDIEDVLTGILYEFPLTGLYIKLPSWMEGLEENHRIIEGALAVTRQTVEGMSRARDVHAAEGQLKSDYFEKLEVKKLELGEGRAELDLVPVEGLFYSVLSDMCGVTIESDRHLVSIIKDMSRAKKEYDRVEEALRSVREEGYGMVPPVMEEMTLEEPEIIKQGGRFGVRLRASAPSLHFIRADIKTEVSPIVGTEKQSEELVRFLLSEFESDPTKIWQTQLFGKTLSSLVNEGLGNKLTHLPEDTRMKVKHTLERMINDGTGGLICIIF